MSVVCFYIKTTFPNLSVIGKAATHCMLEGPVKRGDMLQNLKHVPLSPGNPPSPGAPGSPVLPFLEMTAISPSSPGGPLSP